MLSQQNIGPDKKDSYEGQNVVIILSDQLRRQALSCYGDTNITTPNIDKLAQNGVKFDNACSTYPICVPFRFSLMTGEYAHTRLVPTIRWPMSPTERTLADEFNEAGYETAYIGKWHLGGGGETGSAEQCGRTPVPRSHQGRWQKWYGFELRNDPFDTYYFIDDDPTPHKIEKYQTDGLFDIGMNYLANEWDRSKNFCMCISVEPPHWPFVAPDDLQEKWDETDIELPPNFQPSDDEQRKGHIFKRKRYYAMVENLDENVGRFTKFLKDQQLDDNTIVIFVSDHGELNGAHGYGDKQWPYEESIGIPLIVCDPSHKDRNGTMVSDPVCTEDLFPTILGLAGLTPQNKLPGINLTPLIQGDIEKLGREGVFLEFVLEHRPNLVFHDEVWRGVRTEGFKYTVKGNRLGGKPWQFFDLKNDPFEMNNLIDDNEYQCEIVRHHDLLLEYLQITEDPFVLLPVFGRDGHNVWSEELLKQ